MTIALDTEIGIADVVSRSRLVPLGPVAELARARRSVVVHHGGEYLVIVGRHRVTVALNRCPHMGLSLSTASVGRRTLMCAHHGRRYPLPTAGGAGQPGCAGPAGRLKVFPTQIVDGVLYAEVPSAA